jgi:hypothetical protein
VKQEEEQEGQTVKPKRKRKRAKQLVETPFSPSSTSSNGNTPRTRIACGHCRRSKQKCDNGRPCGRCVIRGREATCRDAGVEDSVNDTDSDASCLSYAPERFFHIFDEVIASLELNQLQTIVLEKPLKLANFLGFVKQITNEDYCKALKDKMVSTLQYPESVLSNVASAEMNVMEYEFAKSSGHETCFLTARETEDICETFNLRYLERGDVAILKLSFLPHKEGPHALKLRYQWNHALELLLETDFETFFSHCKAEQAKYNLSQGTSNFSTFWRLFSWTTYERLVKFMCDAYFADQFKRIEEMELRSLNDQVIPCCARFKVSMYPLVEIPESITIAARVLTAAYNPFQIESQQVGSDILL